MENDVARYQGQLLFDDVTRAAGLMGQLAAYGEEQRNAPEVVDVTKVLRDLAPVLKRVAGEDIDVVLPKVMAPLTLNVDAGPVERMIVNVAAYGRERMPLGGRLMINVDSVVVDRDFVAKYPNVRPGAHVLLTVNEVRSSVRPELAATSRTRSASGWNCDEPRPGGARLGAFVNDCGGHLWMKAEPPGDMVLKIHPRRVLDRRSHPHQSPTVHAGSSAPLALVTNPVPSAGSGRAEKVPSWQGFWRPPFRRYRLIVVPASPAPRVQPLPGRTPGGAPGDRVRARPGRSRRARERFVVGL
jgi:hypothetical protein